MSGVEALQPFVERRAVRRPACAIDVTVRQRGRFAVAAATADLTARGCRLAGAGPFARHSEMFIRLPGLDSQTARVVWSDGPVTGLAFAHPLHPAVCARYLPAHERLALVEDAVSSPGTAAGVLFGASDPVRRIKRPIGGGLAATIRRPT